MFAIYEILSSSLKEMMRVKLIQPSQQILHFDSLQILLELEGANSQKENKFPLQNSQYENKESLHSDSEEKEEESTQHTLSATEEVSKLLFKVAMEAKKINLSGRTLRKLPFLSFSPFADFLSSPPSLPLFLSSLSHSISFENASRKYMEEQSPSPHQKSSPSPFGEKN